jgi:hypothetical protein
MGGILMRFSVKNPVEQIEIGKAYNRRSGYSSAGSHPRSLDPVECGC